MRTDAQNLLKELEGQICWRAWDGLLPAVFFEMGEKDAEARKGTYSVCLDTCPWQVFDHEREIANSKSSPDTVRSTLKRFVNIKLTNFEYTRDTSLQQILFEGGLRITISLQSEEDQWYVLFPQSTIVFAKKGIELKLRS